MRVACSGGGHAKANQGTDKGEAEYRAAIGRMVRVEIPECEMAKAEFLAMPLCKDREDAVASIEEGRATNARYRLCGGEWVCLMPDKEKDVWFVTVLPTVPGFLRAGENVSY